MEMTKKQQTEGPMTEKIENQTAKLPSDTFLWAALGAMAASATLKCLGKGNTALFVGQWAAPFLLFGVYNKIVKNLGHDKFDDPSKEDYTGPEKDFIDQKLQ